MERKKKKKASISCKYPVAFLSDGIVFCYRIDLSALISLNSPCIR